MRLTKRIVKSFIKDELESSKRYTKLGNEYNLPFLVQAGRDEKRHALEFRRLLRRM